MVNPTLEVMDEAVGGVQVSITYMPDGNELCIRADGCPRPDITPALPALLIGQSPLLAAHKRPNLVTLDSFAGEITESFVLIGGTGCTEFRQKFHDGCTVKARDPGCRPEGITLCQAAHDTDTIRKGKFTHDANDRKMGAIFHIESVLVKIDFDYTKNICQIPRMKLDLQNKPELRRKRIELQRWLSIIDIALTESPVTGMGKRPGSSIPSILEPILEKLEDRFNASEAYALVEKPRRQAIKLALREASEAGAIEILQLGKGRRPTVFRKVLVE